MVSQRAPKMARTGHTGPLGKCEILAQTYVPSELKKDLARVSRLEVLPERECHRNILIGAIYGETMLHKCRRNTKGQGNAPDVTLRKGIEMLAFLNDMSVEAYIGKVLNEHVFGRLHVLSMTLVVNENPHIDLDSILDAEHG